MIEIMQESGEGTKLRVVIGSKGEKKDGWHKGVLMF